MATTTREPEKLGRLAFVPPGLSLEQHSAIALQLLSDFLSAADEEEWTIVSKPRLEFARQVGGGYEITMPGGQTAVLPVMHAWRCSAYGTR